MVLLSGRTIESTDVGYPEFPAAGFLARAAGCAANAILAEKVYLVQLIQSAAAKAAAAVRQSRPRTPSRPRPVGPRSQRPIGPDGARQRSNAALKPTSGQIYHGVHSGAGTGGVARLLDSNSSEDKRTGRLGDKETGSNGPAAGSAARPGLESVWILLRVLLSLSRCLAASLSRCLAVSLSRCLLVYPLRLFPGFRKRLPGPRRRPPARRQRHPVFGLADRRLFLGRVRRRHRCGVHLVLRRVGGDDDDARLEVGFLSVRRVVSGSAAERPAVFSGASTRTPAMRPAAAAPKRAGASASACEDASSPRRTHLRAD